MKTRRITSAGLALFLAFASPMAVPFTASPVQAASGLSEITQQLRSSDFRVRVQAVLLLGKLGQAQSLNALRGALQDESIAVRVAAASALGIFGDPAAVPELRALMQDESKAVVRTAGKSIQKLEAIAELEAKERRGAQLFVKLGAAKAENFKSPEALAAAILATKKAFSQIDGVALLRPSEDARKAHSQHGRPVLVIQPTIRRLETSDTDGKTIVSAEVDFLVQGREQSHILGRLRGRASAASYDREDESGRVRLESEAVGAAAESAIRSSKSALLRAAAQT